MDCGLIFIKFGVFFAKIEGLKRVLVLTEVRLFCKVSWDKLFEPLDRVIGWPGIFG